MDQSGYINTPYTRTFNLTNGGSEQYNIVNIVDDGTGLNKKIPAKIRLYGFSIWIPAKGTESTFKFYDGDSTDILLWTTRFFQSGFLGSTAWNHSSMMMQDDSYIEVNNDLHYELEFSGTAAFNSCGITVYF